jgi:hypothetical protein
LLGIGLENLFFAGPLERTEFMGVQRRVAQVGFEPAQTFLNRRQRFFLVFKKPGLFDRNLHHRFEYNAMAFRVSLNGPDVPRGKKFGLAFGFCRHPGLDKPAPAGSKPGGSRNLELPWILVFTRMTT